ncbi:MAG: aminodeoxychorismate lyase [Porticoccaceae bacterium]|jgi:4-amino-4-deoxychorismate lyase|nr:aminodeoxychorismate lyase [Porticoccaceae bacterium]MBT7376138.1 aminodeoxychorismate lyase [Porticoccaceae bacterium]
MLYHSINGQFAATPATRETLLDRGLAYGHGLFESMLLSGGNIALQKRHVKRICQDASRLGIQIQAERLYSYLNDFQDQLKAEDIEAGVVKMILTAGVGGRGYKSPDPIIPKVICLYAELSGEMTAQIAQGIKLWRCEYRLPSNPQLAGIKHLNRLDQVMAGREWSSPDYAEGLMLDQTGNIVEATAANIFIRTDKLGWQTPCLSLAGVSGVMRSVLIEELFPAANIALTVTSVPLKSLETAREVFVCNAIRGIVPVVGIAQSEHFKTDPIKLEIGDQSKALYQALAQRYTCFQ